MQLWCANPATLCHKGALFDRRMISKAASTLNFQKPPPVGTNLKGSSRLYTSKPRTTNTSTSTTSSIDTFEDVFSDTSTMQDAKERWGLGATEYAPIVFPKGRSEIVTRAKQLMQDRISNGHARPKIPKTERNTLRDQQATAALNLRASGRFSATSSSPNPHLHRPSEEGSDSIPQWMKHKLAIKQKLLGKTWNPQRKLSRQAMEEVRYLRKKFPDEWDTARLASHFNVASESIVRILRTDFRPATERAVEQDNTKARKRKDNISADIERIKAERHALWLERKAEREKARVKTGRITSRVKLGAPKRSIGSN
ncbi:Required for respiratory growth protein 9 mitochondrial [Gamsiella multidivaricata]|nr:Required for respiratory growth protein 9 mitochondrial [Gamsiella multidivaricata]